MENQETSALIGMIAELESVIGAPVRLELLRQKAGRRSTYRAHGSRRTAIVKVYDSDQARAVAKRVASLREGPYEPIVPRVWAETDDMVVLSEIPGRPLRASILAGDLLACQRAGIALGVWHKFWRGNAPAALAHHSLARELELLRQESAEAPEPIAGAVAFALKAVENDDEWPPATVIHCDLYEEQVMLGEDVGLIDLDDAAIGPPELDVGNLCAHLDLLSRRYGRSLDDAQRAFLDGYLSTDAPLELQLLLTCRSLSLLRLACIHRSAELAVAHPGSAWPHEEPESEAG